MKQTRRTNYEVHYINVPCSSRCADHFQLINEERRTEEKTKRLISEIEYRNCEN